MDAQGLNHPDVLAMVRLAVRRARHLFANYNDLDKDSLAADMLGEVAKAWPKYNPKLSKPGTFAYRVAWCRLRDISRRRTTEDKNLAKSREIEGVRLSHVGPTEILEGTEAELAEIARRMYVSVKNTYDGAGIDLRPKDLSPVYMDKAQRMALHLLQQRMEWNDRQAAAEIRSKPMILTAIGVTKAPSHVFFHRAAKVVTHVQKIFSGGSIAAAL